MKKKIIGIFVVLCMIISILPISAIADVPKGSFNLNGANSVVAGVFTVTDKGTVKVKIGGTEYTGTDNAFQDVALDTQIMITMTANTNYMGSLKVNDIAIGDSYKSIDGQVATYTFTLNNLGVTAGENIGIDIDFRELANFTLSGSDSIASGVFTVTGKGTATVKIGSTLYNGTSSDFTGVDLEKTIVITMTAATDYAGTLMYNGSAMDTAYREVSGQTATYSFTLNDLGITVGQQKTFNLSFDSTEETGNLQISGWSTVSNGVFTTQNRGTATVKTGDDIYTGDSGNINNIGLNKQIVITMTATNTDYKGVLSVNGTAISENYAVRNDNVVKYTFTLSQLGVTEGNALNVSTDYIDKNADPNPGGNTPQQDTPIPSNAILINLIDFKANSISYDTFHNSPDIGATLMYSYDNITWKDFSNYASDTNCTQAYSTSTATYTYAFQNTDNLYIKLTALTGTDAKISSQAIYGGVETEKINLNQVYTLSKKNQSYDLIWTNGTCSLDWDYSDNAPEDMRVEHGTVNVVSINGKDASTLSDPAHGIGNTSEGGYWSVKTGSTVVLEIKPDYGYQYLGGGFNGETVTSGGEQSTFTFVMGDRNLHFSALFKKMDNTVTTDSKKVKSGDIQIADNEIDSGTVNLSVEDVALSEDQISNFDKAAGDYTISSFIDISLDQLVYKGNTTDVWTNPLKELDNDATVILQLEEGVDGNSVVIVHEKHDGTYEVIPTVYDAETGTITFTTTSFSNYAIAYKNIPKTGDNGNIIAWCSAVMLSGTAFSAMIITNRKRRKALGK